MKPTLTIAIFATAAFVAGCEAPPMESSQTGYRGTGMAQISNPSLRLAADEIPPPPYPLGPDEGPRANETYQNVQVLGDLSTDEFNRLMVSITEWVSPEQGCNYCHNPENMASDEVYTKVVSRRMLQMTRNINASWSSHVKTTGVTCYTCHRGKPVPEYTWTDTFNDPHAGRLVGANRPDGQNMVSAAVAYASLPSVPYSLFLQGNQDAIRVASDSGRPNPAWNPSIKDAEATYGLMMHMSSSLGVNCTHCHNTQSFREWGSSTPARVTAFHGLRMVSQANDEYITPLKSVFPTNRLGPAGDPLKINCTTCHQGKAKPLGGVSMLADHPALAGVRVRTAAAPAPAEGEAETAPATPPADAGEDATPAE